MTAVTYQKTELKKALLHVVMDKYDSCNADERRDIAEGLFWRLVSKMTLRELRNWHDRFEGERTDDRQN